MVIMKEVSSCSGPGKGSILKNIIVICNKNDGNRWRQNQSLKLRLIMI